MTIKVAGYKTNTQEYLYLYMLAMNNSRKKTKKTTLSFTIVHKIKKPRNKINQLILKENLNK